MADPVSTPRCCLSLCALALAAAVEAAGGSGNGAWSYRAAPLARTRVEVDADWRDCDALTVPVRHLGPPSSTPLLCTLYMQNKDGVWMQLRDPIVLTGEQQQLHARLHDRSPDWCCSNAMRPFGRDLVRWVTAWGLQVYARAPQQGVIVVGEPQRLPRAARTPRIFDIDLPGSAAAGQPCAVTFRIEELRGNPYRAAEVACVVRWEGPSGAAETPAHRVQRYIETVHPQPPDAPPRPFERPLWKAAWSNPRPGPHRLTVQVRTADAALTHKLGHIDVAPSPGTRPQTVTRPTTDPGVRFKVPLPAGRRLRFDGDRWLPAANAAGATQAWHVVLDWTPRWGSYTGAGEFDQRTAWSFERALRNHRGHPLPLLLFTDDVLDNRGTYNWVDHPLNSANGGPVESPFGFFRHPRARELFADRTRYLWQRFGGSRAVDGCFLAARHPEQDVLDWLGCAAEAFGEMAPGARLAANNPELLARDSERALGLTADWRIEPRLSDSPSVSVAASPPFAGAFLRCADAASAGLSARGVRHWTGADTLAFDVRGPAATDDVLRAVCQLRVEPEKVFQSRVHLLRQREVTRLLFPLRRPEHWRCLQDVDRELQPYDLLNVREVALRFFRDRAGRWDIDLGDGRLLGPYAVDRRARPPLAIRNVAAPRSRVPVYTRYELVFRLNRAFRNPYDPRVVDVAAEIRTPDGRILKHPAFFHEPWEPVLTDGVETVSRAGAPDWRLRFAPTAVGTYNWTLLARADGETATASGSFEAVPGRSRGFVRRAREDPRYFEFSNGEFFYPMGHNLRSPADGRTARSCPSAVDNIAWAGKAGTEAYLRWFRRLNEAGANWARVWMCPWWCGLEWNEEYGGYHGLGYYNQANAARLDKLVEAAEREAVYLALETLNHGSLSVRVDADWKHNPLNARTQRGGLIDDAMDFFAHEESLRLHRNKLRYVLARWGYSTAVAWWGILTEAEWVAAYEKGRGRRPPDPTLPWERKPGPPPPDYYQYFLRWVEDTANFLRTAGAHPHLVSIHFSNPNNGLELWKMPSLDIVRNNAYTVFASRWWAHRFPPPHGVVDVMREFCNAYEPYARDKPLVIGEWGGHPIGNRESHLVTEFHTGHWAMLMTRTAGATGYWWWNLADARGLYGTYRAIAAFLRGEDRRGKHYRGRRAELSFPNQPADPARRRHGQVLFNGSELQAYLCSPAINAADDSRPPSGFDDPSFPPSGEGTLRAPDMLRPGRYRLEYWNTFTGERISGLPVTLSTEQRDIPLISHRVDLAVKLKPEPSE